MAIATIKPEFLPEICRALEDRQVLNCALAEAKLKRYDKLPFNERMPLRDGGDDWATVEASIPAKHLFQLMQQKNFGYEGLMSDEGMRDLLKAYPQFRVKTVSGRVQSGWTPGRRVVKKWAP